MASKPKPPRGDIAEITPSLVAPKSDIRDRVDSAAGIAPEVVPTFSEQDGNKYLSRPSLHTATFVQGTFIRLESEARHAMEMVQQERVKNKCVSVDAVLRLSPTIGYLANNKEIDELMKSYPGHPDARKWTTEVFARALQKPPETISKYARKKKYVIKETE